MPRKIAVYWFVAVLTTGAFWLAYFWTPAAFELTAGVIVAARLAQGSLFGSRAIARWAVLATVGDFMMIVACYFAFQAYDGWKIVGVGLGALLLGTMESLGLPAGNRRTFWALAVVASHVLAISAWLWVRHRSFLQPDLASHTAWLRSRDWVFAAVAAGARASSTSLVLFGRHRSGGRR
jgi:hypothetical protein